MEGPPVSTKTGFGVLREIAALSASSLQSPPRLVWRKAIHAEQTCLALMFQLNDRRQFGNESIYGIWFNEYVDFKRVLASTNVPQARFKYRTTLTVPCRVENRNRHPKVAIAVPLSCLEIDRLPWRDGKSGKLFSPVLQCVISCVHLSLASETPAGKTLPRICTPPPAPPPPDPASCVGSARLRNAHPCAGGSC